MHINEDNQKAKFNYMRASQSVPINQNNYYDYSRNQANQNIQRSNNIYNSNLQSNGFNIQRNSNQSFVNQITLMFRMMKDRNNQTIQKLEIQNKKIVSYFKSIKRLIKTTQFNKQVKYNKNSQHQIAPNFNSFQKVRSNVFISKQAEINTILQNNENKNNKVKLQHEEMKKKTKGRLNQDKQYLDLVRNNQQDSAQSYLVQENQKIADQKLYGLKRKKQPFNILNYQKNTVNHTLDSEWKRQIVLINQFLQDYFLGLIQQISKQQQCQKQKIHKKEVFSMYCSWRKKYVNEKIGSTEGIQAKGIQAHLTNQLKKVISNCRVDRSYFVGIKFKKIELLGAKEQLK